MTDIVERLRERPKFLIYEAEFVHGYLQEAADEIERLREKVERLEAALADMLEYYTWENRI